MSKSYQSVATCLPSSKDNSYVYAIVPVISHGLAAVTSADELVVLDRRDLSSQSMLKLANVPRNVSCLALGDDAGNLVLCSGGDGTVATFDIRSATRVSHFKTDRAITALTYKDGRVAIGTEFARHEAIVSMWDPRQARQVWQNAENSDDITAVELHPSKSNVLLAGVDDGQVSIFDTNVTEEDDSLLQGVNHGPIHKAGFLGDTRFFALSSDQNLSVYPVSQPDDTEDPPPTTLGDLRSVIPCEYVINVFRSGHGYAVAAGSNNNDQRVDIVELRHATDPSKAPKLKVKSSCSLAGGHGEEVVRSVFADDTTGLIYTAGEDGQIKAFRLTEGASSAGANATSSVRFKQGPEGRYRPY